MAGNLLAKDAITLGDAATILCGRALAMDAAITMDANSISNDCTNGGDLGSGRSDYGSHGFSGGASGAVPEPGAWAMMLVGLGVLGAAMRRRRPDRLLGVWNCQKIS